MYQISRIEQETTIRWDAAENVAHIYTAHPVTLRKLEGLSAEYPDVYRLVWTDTRYPAKKYEVDAKYIRFGKPASEAQRNASKIKATKSILRRENTSTG